MTGKALATAVVHAIERAIAPLKQLAARTGALEEKIASIPEARDGRDGVPGPRGLPGDRGEKGEKGERGDPGAKGNDGVPGPPGEKGEPGVRGASGEKGEKGEDAEPIDLRDVIAELANASEIKTLLTLLVAEAVQAQPVRDGKDGQPGIQGERGEKGEPGREGSGIADLLIDRDGKLVATMTDGRMKILGAVIGRDGANGKDGRDGLSAENFTREYLPDTHEIRERWSCAGEQKELVYPAGGIRHGGYWREGTRAKSGQTWVRGGTCFIATCDTTESPTRESKDWQIFASKGRDGLDGKDGKPPPGPVKLA